MSETLGKLFSVVLGFLPDSPFQAFLNSIGKIPYLQELNWFFPVGECLLVVQAWLLCIAAYYMYMAIMRFIGIIS